MSANTEVKTKRKKKKKKKKKKKQKKKKHKKRKKIPKRYPTALKKRRYYLGDIDLTKEAPTREGRPMPG